MDSSTSSAPVPGTACPVSDGSVRDGSAPISSGPAVSDVAAAGDTASDVGAVDVATADTSASHVGAADGGVSSVGPPAAGPRLGVGPLGIAVRVVAAVGVLLAANLVVGLVPLVASLVPGARDLFSGSSPWAFVLAVVMQGLVLVLVVGALRAWMRRVERATLRAAGWRWSRRSAGWMLLGITLAGGSVVGVTAVLPAVGPSSGAEALLGGQTATPAVIAGFVVYFLGLAFLQQGVPEELLFRGWLLWRLRHRPVVAVVVTTLAFTVIHLVSNGGQESAVERVLYLALPLGFGLLAAGLVMWTGSLWAAAGVHGGFHLGNYLALAMLPQVDAVASWLAVGGVHAVAGIVLTLTALRRGRGILDGRD